MKHKAGEVSMVYCTKCGTKNPDDAKNCTQCGAPLYAVGETERRRIGDECAGRRAAGEPYRRMEYECFGIPIGGAVVGIAIGVIILLAGVIWLMQQAGIVSSNISAWPIAAIIFGILIVIGALYGLSRRR
jgi:uncharacterized membrane protein YvbJ